MISKNIYAKIFFQINGQDFTCAEMHFFVNKEQSEESSYFWSWSKFRNTVWSGSRYGLKNIFYIWQQLSPWVISINMLSIEIPEIRNFQNLHYLQRHLYVMLGFRCCNTKCNCVWVQLSIAKLGPMTTCHSINISFHLNKALNLRESRV